MKKEIYNFKITRDKYHTLKDETIEKILNCKTHLQLIELVKSELALQKDLYNLQSWPENLPLRIELMKKLQNNIPHEIKTKRKGIFIVIEF